MKADPPTEADFQSHKERWPAKDFGDKECQACGLSVFRDWADMERMSRDVPGMAKKFVAMGLLQPTDGAIKPTPAPSGPSHQTWWKNPEVSVAARFAVVSDDPVGAT